MGGVVRGDVVGDATGGGRVWWCSGSVVSALDT